MRPFEILLPGLLTSLFDLLVEFYIGRIVPDMNPKILLGANPNLTKHFVNPKQNLFKPKTEVTEDESIF